MRTSKGSLRNNVDKIAAGFLSTDEAAKRSNATCLASFGNEVCRQKDKERCQDYFVTTPKEMADEVWRRVDASENSMREKRRKIYSIVTVAACLAVVIGLAIIVPSIPAEDAATIENTATGTLFSGSAVGGYVLVGVIAFMLGVIATLFCVKMRRKK